MTASPVQTSSKDLPERVVRAPRAGIAIVGIDLDTAPSVAIPGEPQRSSTLPTTTRRRLSMPIQHARRVRHDQLLPPPPTGFDLRQAVGQFLLRAAIRSGMRPSPEEAAYFRGVLAEEADYNAAVERRLRSLHEPLSIATQVRRMRLIESGEPTPQQEGGAFAG